MERRCKFRVKETTLVDDGILNPLSSYWLISLKIFPLCLIPLIKIQLDSRETRSVDSWDCSDDSWFSVSDMSDGSDIESGLSAHDLRCIWGEFGNILIVLWFELLILRIEFFDFLFGKPGDVLHDMVIIISDFLLYLSTTEVRQNTNFDEYC